MRKCMIVAMAKNRAIGKDNKLLWHISEDLKYFKKLTKGNIVLMGRKTYESIGKPLPNRENIILTRNENYQPEGVRVVNSLLDISEYFADLSENDDQRNFFVIGGGAIYEQFMDFVDYVYLTLVDQEPEADTFFPEFEDKFELINDDKQEGFSFLTYKRIKD